uniref:Uncharacterized protein n=1 Tax=Glossina pallidipes TaxID=7398 RepID=A0A1B0A7Y4_GLOPL
MPPGQTTYQQLQITVLRATIYQSVTSSNATQVLIRNVGFGLSGNFSCEVTADAPLFSTATAIGTMQVVELPDKRPQLFTEHTRYEPGDVLRANCSTPPSRPRAELKFTINNMVKLLFMFPVPSERKLSSYVRLFIPVIGNWKLGIHIDVDNSKNPIRVTTSTHFYLNAFVDAVAANAALAALAACVAVMANDDHNDYDDDDDNGNVRGVADIPFKIIFADELFTACPSLCMFSLVTILGHDNSSDIAI